MLGSSAGIEREQIFLKELEDYPYAYSEELVGLVQKILREDCGEDKSDLKTALNECVMKMYDLQDNYFVDYVLSIQIPFPIDHSFLKYKKELLDYGYQVGKISMKGETVAFERAKIFE